MCSVLFFIYTLEEGRHMYEPYRAWVFAISRLPKIAVAKANPNISS